MSNENLIKTLVETIMNDERFVSLLQNMQTVQPVSGCKTLYLIEKSADCSLVSGFPGQPVFCQEQADSAQGYIDYQQVEKSGFEQLILLNPSFNLICKLAMGIADEPIAMILQKRMAKMDGQLTITSLKNVEEIKNPVFGQFIRKQLDVLQNFGFQISMSTTAMPISKQETPSMPSGNLRWYKKALTEKDMFGIEKNGIITVDEKCIVTSLATDMARRRGIKINREGDTQ
jgi:hypothetical protein